MLGDVPRRHPILYTETMSLDNETNVSCADQFPQDQFKTTAIVRAATGPVSIVLAALAILINILYKKYRFQFHLMVLCMSVGSLMRGFVFSLSFVDYVVKNEATRAGICAALGFWDAYTLWIVLLSTVSLAYSLFADFGVSNSAYGDKQRRRCFWLSLIFAFPLSFLWVPFINLAYGRSPDFPWCTIRVLDEKCEAFRFGKVISVVLVVAVVSLSCLLVLLYVATALILIRRQRRWKVDPDSVQINRYQKRCWFLFLLPLSAFMAALVLGVARAVIQTKNTFVLDIINSAYNPTAIVAFTLTVVDKELCRRPLLGLLRSNSSAKLYKVMFVREQEVPDSHYYTQLDVREKV